MIGTLVRNELRIKASWYTDKSLFSVAFEARIWLYVGLCCDAGRLDSVTVPGSVGTRAVAYVVARTPVDTRPVCSDHATRMTRLG